MTADEISIDACDLEPPEPYELTTETLTRLRPGQYVRLIIPRRPRMLYPWLQENNFNEITKQLDEDRYEIYIWASNDHDTGNEIKKVLE